MRIAPRFVKYLIKFWYGVYFRIICVFCTKSSMIRAKYVYKESKPM